jgi:hypothetical protein
MSGAQDPREAELNEARSKLDQGLRNCRAVVKDYRTALFGKAVRRRRAANSPSD